VLQSPADFVDGRIPVDRYTCLTLSAHELIKSSISKLIIAGLATLIDGQPTSIIALLSCHAS